MSRVAIYVRVSTIGQTTENQLRELRAVAKREGHKVVAEFTDNGISGAKNREARPGLNSLLEGVTRREFDKVMAWSVDRLGRSLQDLLTFIAELKAKGVDLYLHQQHLDTATPAGKAMYQMCGVFAEFERCMIRDRVNSGLARAKANGVEMGRGKRKDGERNADEVRWGMSTAEMEKRILSLRNEGKGILKIGRELGVGTALVQRVLA
jgi:DNA invertase Pin-like site-specific DNA recombinase